MCCIYHCKITIKICEFKHDFLLLQAKFSSAVILIISACI